MTAPHLRRGQDGEHVAARFLAGKGLRIVARNYRTGGGELDLVCLDGETVVFVEVKTRGAAGRGRPEEAVTPAKQRRLVRVAAAFLSEQDWWDRPCRFDVVAVEVRAGASTATHLPDAFGLDAAVMAGFYQPG